jgi:CHAT domain-containing protein
MRTVLDTLIQIDTDEGRPPSDSLIVSERGKARLLWDWIVAGPASLPSATSLPSSAPFAAANLAELQHDLPERTVVLDYAVLPDRTVCWLLSRGRPILTGTLPVRAAALESLVSRVRQSILEPPRPGSGGDKGIEPMEQLYDLLVRPLSNHIQRDDRLIVVPDGALHLLPFSALRDSQTHRFLIQDHAIVIAPSLLTLTSGYRRDTQLSQGSTRRLLVVSSPDFDPALEPTLAPLSGKDVNLARIFPDSRVLSGRAATADAFLGLAGGFDMVHLGGHAIVSPSAPLTSRLVLARNSADPGRQNLYSSDLLRTSFAKTRLVVLASCSTAVGEIHDTEGAQNLARPFLAAGVPVVVASLWDLDDGLVDEIFGTFYGALRRRFDPAAALRTAQVDMIEHASAGARPPATWAGLEVIGMGHPAPGVGTLASH